MAKFCPQCKNENPSAANFCMFCNKNLLSDGEQMSESDQLHAELAEAKEKITELRKLKKALEKTNADLRYANETLKKDRIDPDDNLQQKIDNLSQQITDKNNQIISLNHQLTVAPKKRGNVAWVVIFILLSIGLGCATSVYYQESKDYMNSYHRELDSNSSFKEQITQLKSKEKDINNEKEKIQKKIDSISMYYPIIIKSMKIGNIDNDGNIETDFGNTIYSYSTMFLKPQIEYIGLRPKQTITLYQKLYKGGTLSTATSSPTGYSTKYDLYVNNEGKIGLTAWGNSRRGHWASGSYRYEIWYNNMCLKSVDFFIK